MGTAWLIVLGMDVMIVRGPMASELHTPRKLRDDVCRDPEPETLITTCPVNWSPPRAKPRERSGQAQCQIEALEQGKEGLILCLNATRTLTNHANNISVKTPGGGPGWRRFRFDPLTIKRRFDVHVSRAQAAQPPKRTWAGQTRCASTPFE